MRLIIYLFIAILVGIAVLRQRKRRVLEDMVNDSYENAIEKQVEELYSKGYEKQIRQLSYTDLKELCKEGMARIHNEPIDIEVVEMAKIQIIMKVLEEMEVDNE